MTRVSVPSTSTEPASARAGAGSRDSQSLPQSHRRNDLARFAIIAVLAALAATSFVAAIVFGPFLAVLVAIGLRRREHRRVAFVTGASIVASIAALAVRSALHEVHTPLHACVVVGVAIIASGVLGAAHALAARPEQTTVAISAADVPPAQGDRPALLPDDQADSAWPEPRLLDGLSLAVLAWCAALLVMLAMLVPFIDPLPEIVRSGTVRLMRDYVRECQSGGVLNPDSRTCVSAFDARDQINKLVAEHANVTAAVLLSLLAATTAVSAHYIVLLRQRATVARPRRAYRLRELEVHWAWAYVTAAGLGGWMLANRTQAVDSPWEAGSLGVLVVGGFMLCLQGLGNFAWMRSRVPGRWPAIVVITVLVLVMFAYLPFILMLQGMLDMMLRSRRRRPRSVA